MPENESSDAQMNYQDSLFLSHSDSHAASLTPMLFDGTNFMIWSRNVKLALGAKNKRGFIEGKIPKPAAGHKDYTRTAANTRKLEDEINSPLDEDEYDAGTGSSSKADEGIISFSNVASIHEKFDCNSWIIDSGASDHMAGNKRLFCDLRKLSRPVKVILLDGSIKEVVQIGTVKFRPKIVLYDVLFLPEFKNNLLSLCKIIRIFRYLRGTADIGLVYGNGKECLVTGYSDSDYAADVDTRRSVTGYVFTLGGSVGITPNMELMEQYVHKFWSGVIPWGPYEDHILSYWNESKKNPQNVLFLEYEGLKKEPKEHLKRLAEFVGYPFSKEEEKENVIDEIIELCSLKSLKDMDVNKSTMFYPWFEYKAFFRKGEVGDWTNYLTPSMAKRIDQIQDKLKKAGFSSSYYQTNVIKS
uniref:Sulfotransferase n=1 Tax=Chenopodium quinoa TaxID=63459 RepID=A0A803LM65_CHEQI